MSNRASITATDTASIGTIIQRFAFLNNPDIFDDDDDDDDDEEEEEVENKRDVTSNNTTSSTNTASMGDGGRRQMTMTGRFLEALHEHSHEDICSTSSSADNTSQHSRVVVVSGVSHPTHSGEMIDQEELSSGEVVVNKPIDISTPPPPPHPLIQQTHSLDQFDGSLSSMAPLEIKTDFAGQFDNRKSPREQLFKLSMELEAKNNENAALRDEIDKLKLQIKTVYEPELEELRDKNKSISAEFECFKKLLLRMDESGKDTTELKQVQNENQAIKQENSRLSEQLNILVQKNEHLKKYEQLVSQMKFTSVNSNLYILVSEIGAGGFSRVYQALRMKDWRNCAIKRVDLSKLDPESIGHVKNEIRLLKGLHGTQKCIQLIEDEHVVTKNQLNIVMELGSSDLNSFFKKLIKENGHVPEPTRAYYWYKMLQAVEAIHNKDVIHSDLKPGNFIMVGCECKLIDFNTSTAMSSERTSITMSTDCGTMQYMAPEMLMKNEESKSMINTKTDIWSMGCILYYMAYGKLPFQRFNQYQLFYAICDAKQTSIRYEPKLDDPLLEDCIRMCLAYDCKDRPSATQLLQHPYLNRK